MMDRPALVLRDKSCIKNEGINLHPNVNVLQNNTSLD